MALPCSWNQGILAKDHFPKQILSLSSSPACSQSTSLIGKIRVGRPEWDNPRSRRLRGRVRVKPMERVYAVVKKLDRVVITSIINRTTPRTAVFCVHTLKIDDKSGKD